MSGPTAPCSSSPAATCSDSRVGEEGGEGRDLFLLEDNSFRRLFFSLCQMKTRQCWKSYKVSEKRGRRSNNLHILVCPAGQSCGGEGGADGSSASRAHRHGSRRFSLQTRGTHVGWGQRGGRAAHGRRRCPGAALSWIGGGLLTNYQVWEEGDRCCGLHRRHCRRRPVLTVTGSCSMEHTALDTRAPSQPGRQRFRHVPVRTALRA